MKHLLSRFLSAFLAFALAPAAAAQSTGNDGSIAGTYEIQDQNGNPIDPAYVYQITIVAIPGFTGLYVSVVTRDRIEGPGEADTGKEVIPGEGTFIFATGPGTYGWENARGTTGTIEEDGTGDLDSEVTSGPNTGTKRHFDN